MTQPPQPGPWDGQQPGQWQQGAGYPGGPMQPGAPGPYGGPGQFGPPQQQWPGSVPPKKGGAGKWVLGAVALVAVIAVTAVVAVSCTKNSGGGGGSSAPNNTSIASANDTGPVGIITEDPSCAPWYPITKTLSEATKNGWDKRDPSIPASGWTPEQRSQYEAAAQAMRSAADQTVALVKLTPHRVMRELYEQFIAYTRAYVSNIPTYRAADDSLNTVASTIISVANSICGAITYGSAAMRGPLVDSGPSPQNPAQPGDVSNPSKFMLTPDPECAEWKSTGDKFSSDPALVAWLKEDTTIPSAEWSEQYKLENQTVAPVLTRMANEYERLGRQSTNPVVSDIGILASQYLRGFVGAIPTYTSSDGQLYNVFSKAGGIILSACSVVGTN